MERAPAMQIKELYQTDMEGERHINNQIIVSGENEMTDPREKGNNSKVLNQIETRQTKRNYSDKYGRLHITVLDGIKGEMRAFIADDSAIGVVEIILILVVLIALVFIFKNQLTALLKEIFGEIDSGASRIY